MISVKNIKLYSYTVENKIQSLYKWLGVSAQKKIVIRSCSLEKPVVEFYIMSHMM